MDPASLFGLYEDENDDMLLVNFLPDSLASLTCLEDGLLGSDWALFSAYATGELYVGLIAKIAEAKKEMGMFGGLEKVKVLNMTDRLRGADGSDGVGALEEAFEESGANVEICADYVLVRSSDGEGLEIY